MHLRTQVTGTTAKLHGGFDPMDIYIEWKKKGAQCRVTCAGTAKCEKILYVAFDGTHAHFTDGNSGKTLPITLYKSTTRDFVVQAIVDRRSGMPCALAGREGHDRVMINACSGKVALETDFQSQKAADQPRIDVNGTTQ